MNSLGRFLQVADRIGAESSLFSDIVADPWPDWFLKVVLRLARVFTPELKAADLRERPEVFHGYLAGSLIQLTKAANEIDLSEIADGSLFAFLKEALPRMCEAEGTAIRDTLAAADSLPSDEYTSFFSAYGSALKERTAYRSLERMIDSPTVQICLFVLFMRRHIEAGRFKTVSELLNLYIKLDEATGGEQFPTESSRESFKKQFRKICSESGLKLKGKGRPKKM